MNDFINNYEKEKIKRHSIVLKEYNFYEYQRRRNYIFLCVICFLISYFIFWKYFNFYYLMSAFFSVFTGGIIGGSFASLPFFLTKVREKQNELLSLASEVDLINKKNPYFWENLKGTELEVAAANLLTKLFGVELKLTRKVADNGIDIIGPRIIVQCKGHKKKVGEPALRDFYGSAMAISKYNTPNCLFVSPNGFTKPAVIFAEKKMSLFDKNKHSRVAGLILDKVVNEKIKE